MNYVVFDCETTIKNKGNPFTKSNRLCLVGIKDKDGYTSYDIEYSDQPYGDKLQEIKRRIEAADLVVGFNAKFDIHWLMRYVDISFPRLFDCQLAEFLLGNQLEPYPALDIVASRRGLGTKLDIVSSEYWEHDIDTPDIPLAVLEPYLQRDVELTEQVYLQQRTELGSKTKLFKLQCADLLLLAEMERNGLRYDFEHARRLGASAKVRLKEIDEELCDLSHSTGLNWNSSEHVSAALFGGVVYERFRETYSRTLKDGTVKLKERWSERPVEFPRLLTPPERSELDATAGISDSELQQINRGRSLDGKKPLRRFYSVAEPVLRRIKAGRGKGKRIVSLLLERAKLEKLDSTYYTGLAEKIAEYEWEPDTIHGSFNQCVVVTGRLSSSKPNLQNFAGDIKELFYSRYARTSGV